MQVYLALYGAVSEETKFLIAKKNMFAHFFDKKKMRNPEPIKNGPGSWVFPGGRAGKQEDYLQGAYREFYEETGILEKDILHSNPPTCIGTNYKVFFVNCYNLQEIVEKISSNLHNSSYITDDELDSVKLATADESIKLFKESGELSSWFLCAITNFCQTSRAML